MIGRVRRDGTCLTRGIAPMLLALGVVLGAATHAQTSPKTPPAGTADGVSWSALTPAQQAALAPLKKDWPYIDAPRRQKWLEIATRLPSMPAEERERIQQRMNEWARMTPDERGRARLQFQEARQISPQQRQARWDAYMALPVEERRALAASARTIPKATAAGTSARKKDGAAAAQAQPAAKVVAPTVVQANPGASTRLISQTAVPPPHAQAGQPKIAAGKGMVDRSTLLPQARPQGAAASAAQ